MQRQLSLVPPPRRLRAAAALGLLAALLVTAGILPWTAAAPTSVRVIAVAALVAGVLAAGIGWGLASSVRNDARLRAEAELDALLTATGGGCDCGGDHSGHDHAAAAAGGPDAGDWRATDTVTGGPAAAPCPSDGAGTDCAHSCAACVLARR